MDSVKTYEQVNREDNSFSFGISKTESIFEKHKGKPDEPHRHNYYTIILIQKAKGTHGIDFCDYELADNQIYFIAPGQVHQMREDKASIGFSMVFSDQFLVKNNIPLSFIKQLHLFNEFGQSPPLSLNQKELNKLSSYAVEIFELHHSNLQFKYDAIGSLLKLILINCNNVCSLPKGYEQNLDPNNTTLFKFKELVNTHYKEWHGTSNYATQLHITPDYLNRIVKSQTGKTAKEHIQSRIMVAAKRLIYFSNLSNKEIGFELGFSEPANFSAFFKKLAGQSPSQFKEKA